MIRALIAMGLVVLGGAASSHEKWADGSAIPAWVASSCCGSADSHMLTAEDVFEETDGWHVRGLRKPVQPDRVHASQDGRYWAFYPETGPEAFVYCLFVPMTM